MDGIVAQQQRRKEWRVVHSAMDASPASSNPANGLPQVRQRFPGPASNRQRNGRVFHPATENPTAEKLSQAKNSDEQGEKNLDHEEGHIDDLQRQLSEISRQREQLQQMELELRVQYFARSEILRLQTSFDEQAKQHNEIVNGLREQLQQREEQMQQMQQHAEERERQLQMEMNEARNQVWTKDAVIMEQNNELATLRRERDNALADRKADAAQMEAERAEHHAEVESLKEQVREKDRRIQEMEEQDILFLRNDKQLRDAQLWMARSQELEAYHMNAMHAEIRERTEQMNQMSVHYQRQLTELERYYQQIIQKLQQDLEAQSMRNREISKVIEPSMSLHQKPPILHFEAPIPMMIPPDGLSTVEHATGLPVIPTQVMGITSVVPPSATIPPYGPATPIQFTHPPPVLIRPPIKHQQVIQRQHHQPQQQQQQQQQQKHGQNSAGQIPEDLHKAENEKPNITQVNIPQENSIFSGLTPIAPPEKQQFNSVIERTKGSPHVTEKSLENENRTNHQVEVKNHDLEHNHMPEQQSFPAEVPREIVHNRNGETSSKEAQIPVDEPNGKLSESHLMDRDSLLACLIRVIPAEPSAKIRISTTLPNRLAKVLAPLHWHDYRKHYGRLDEFIEAHSQLFVVEGDCVYLREGAHAIAVAKAAAAAASGGSHTHQAPTVALTPVAQPQQQRTRYAKGGKDNVQGGGDNNGNVQQQGNYKTPNYKGQQAKRPQNGYGNGVLDGYVNFNGGSYFKNMHEPSRNQELGARPLTQEGRILEAA